MGHINLFITAQRLATQRHYPKWQSHLGRALAVKFNQRKSCSVSEMNYGKQCKLKVMRGHTRVPWIMSSSMWQCNTEEKGANQAKFIWLNSCCVWLGGGRITAREMHNCTHTWDPMMGALLPIWGADSGGPVGAERVRRWGGGGGTDSVLRLEKVENRL